jgi:hypothetical protein
LRGHTSLSTENESAHSKFVEEESWVLWIDWIKKKIDVIFERMQEATNIMIFCYIFCFYKSNF